MSSFLSFRLIKKYINQEIRNDNIKKIESAENLLFKRIADDKKNLISSERFLQLLFEQTSFFKIDSLNSIKITAERKGDNLKKTFRIPKINFKNPGIRNYKDLSDKMLYINNTYIEIWQKQGSDFIRTASSKPNDKNYIYISENNELAKEMLTGTEAFKRITSESDFKFSLSFPVRYNGNPVFYIIIENNENLLSSVNILFSDQGDEFIVADKDGQIIFGSNEGGNIFEQFNKQKNNLRDNTKPEILTYNSKTLILKYIPEYEIFIGLLPNNMKSTTVFSKSKQSVFFISLILAIIFLLLFLLYEYRNRENENKIFANIKEILPEEHRSFHTLSETGSFLKKYLNEIKTFVNKIAKGDYSKITFENSPKDEIFSNLKNITNTFIKINEKEIEKQKELELKVSLDKTAVRISETLQYASNIEDLSYKAIKHIAEFTGAEQIAMFIVAEDLQKNKSLQMTASYAYSKKRTVHKELSVNEGLIGRAYLEKKTVFLTEIPDNYAFIESGFGFQKPHYLFIIPLIFNNNVQAIIELGSINSIEDYQIKFIEDTGENIASTVANLKHSLQTEMLLNHTREQSEQIENQRKTLEEKINTHRKQNRNLDKEILQLIEIIDSIKSVSFLIEYDLKGNIIDISNKMINYFDAGKEYFISKSHKDIIVNNEYNAQYRSFWTDLEDNKTQYVEEKIKAGNKEITFKQTYVPIRNVRRKIYRILSIGTIKD